MTRTEASIIALLKDGCYLYVEDSTAATVSIRHRSELVARQWTTRKTVRKMVAQGLLNKNWMLPEEGSGR